MGMCTNTHRTLNDMGYVDLIQKVTVPEGVSGDWKVERFHITKAEANFSCIRDGYRSVREGDYTRLMCGDKVVMSDTPAEMSDHWKPVHMATGKVLIHGLGLGMFLSAIMRKPEVTEIMVVEKSPDVIKLIWPHYEAQDTDHRVTVMEGDAFTWTPPKGKVWDVVWHDIWNDLCTDNMKEMTTLCRRYGRRAKWQGCWSKDHLKYSR